MKNKNLIASAFLGALAALPVTAQAEHGLYGAAMGSVVSRDSSLPAEIGYGAHLVLGGPLSAALGWEVNAFANENDVDNGPGEFESLGLGADLVLPFLQGPALRPFALAGAGVQRDKIPGVSDENSPYINLGVGLLYPIAKNLDLRSELRAYAIHYDNFPGNNTALDVRFNIGLGFGGHGKAAPAAVATSAPAAAPAAEKQAAAPVAEKPAAAPAAAVAGDKDSDKDGVMDSSDRCPNTPAGSAVDAQGCVVLEKIELKGVTFARGSAQLEAGSKPVLNAAVETLKANPEIKLEVGGHTDTNGKADANLKLSQARAESVKTYLVSQGVAADRLSAKGYGQNQPVDTNDTPAGRAKNRRVAFKLQ